MKVLVTDAEGVLGNNLVRHLLNNGFSVRTLKANEAEDGYEDLPVDQVTGDLLDPESTLNALRGAQAVFHCLRLTLPGATGDPKPPASYIQGTRNLLVAMSRAGVENLVHVGSATSFGFGTEDEPGTEESPYAGSRFGWAALGSLLKAQQLVLRYTDEGRIRGVVVNPTLSIGPYARADDIGAAILGYVASSPRYWFSGGVNLVGAKDAAVGVLKALGRGKPGQCYILGGHNISYRELFEKIAGSFRVPAPTRSMPAALRIAAGQSGSFMNKMGVKRLFTAPASRLSSTHMYYSAAKALDELELPMTPVDDVIEVACRWATDKGLVSTERD